MMIFDYIGLFQKKSTPPRRKACWKISQEWGGGGGNGSGNPDGRGALYLKIHPRGVTFNFIDVLIALIDKFAKNCDALSNFIILSNYGPLTTFILSFHP